MKRSFGLRLKRIFGDYIEDSLNIEIATAPPRDNWSSLRIRWSNVRKAVASQSGEENRSLRTTERSVAIQIKLKPAFPLSGSPRLRLTMTSIFANDVKQSRLNSNLLPLYLDRHGFASRWLDSSLPARGAGSRSETEGF